VRTALGLTSLCLFVVLCTPLQAQITFQRTYGGADTDLGGWVQPTADSGYIMSGYTASFGAGGYDGWLVKTDARGDTVWTKTYGGTNRDELWTVGKTTDGGFILAGTTYSFGAGDADVWLIRVDAHGETLWTRTYGSPDGEWGYFATQTSDGGYIVTGTTTDVVQPSRGYYLVKTDSAGDTLWTRTSGSSSNGEYIYMAAETFDGGFVFIGYWQVWTPNGHGDVHLVKTDMNGDTLWTRSWGGASETDVGYTVVQCADSGFFITGMSGSFSPYHGIYLIRTDEHGDTLWTRPFPQSMFGEQGRSGMPTDDGGYIIAGSDEGPAQTLVLLKVDASGNPLWKRNYEGSTGPGQDAGIHARQSLDGGYIVSGYTNSAGAGRHDAWLIKTDSEGNVAVAEREPAVVREANPATLVRGVLMVPRDMTELPGNSDRVPRPTLLDAIGRKVLDLQPGASDIRALAPGVYFVRQPAAATKIVIQH